MRTDVDVVVAVHDPRRRIERAVRSILTSRAVSNVIVVCHNTPLGGILERLGDLATDPRVVMEEFCDGVSSPAGPFNHGLSLSTASFVSIVGSDDELEVGAIDRWLDRAHRQRADVVIPVLRHAGGARVATPPTRFGRANGLVGVRDRLAYRTAPLGLISRNSFGDLRFTEGLQTGEDLAYSTTIWFSGAKISRVRSGAAYLIHDDAERVTFRTRPIRDDLAALALLFRNPHITRLPKATRTALAVKLWRIPMFGAAHYRVGRWTLSDRAEMAVLVRDLTDFAPDALRYLSRADRRLIDVLEDESVPADVIDDVQRVRRRFGTPRTLVPAEISMLFARESPLRYFLATVAATRF